MGRVINPNPPSKERNQITRALVISLRRMNGLVEFNDEARDLASFVILSMHAITKTVDKTIEAWEKRGYWLKADKFRREWIWVEKYSMSFLHAFHKSDWFQIQTEASKIAEKLTHVEVSKNHRMGQPWIGAWEKLQNQVPLD